MQSLPKVSVIIPLYNGEEFIKETIESVLNQDYSGSIEIIVVDDGSTDHGPEIVSSFGESAQLIEQRNSGPSSARNTGLRNCNGEFIAFIDSDDVWYSGKIRSQVEYLSKHPEIGAVYGNWHVWCPDDNSDYPDPSLDTFIDYDLQIEDTPKGWIYYELLLDSVIFTSTVMIRRNIIDEIGEFNPDLMRGEDYDYWFRISRVTQVHKLKAVLACYRQHGSSVTTSYPNRHYGFEVLMEAVNQWGLTGPDGRKLPKKQFRERVGTLAFIFARYHFHNGNYTLARKYLFKAAVNQPLMINAWGMLILSCFRYSNRC
ncbi:MAG: glycosyltransferase [Sedimenticola sp.]